MVRKTKVFLTGATGFVGGGIFKRIKSSTKYQCVIALRKINSDSCYQEIDCCIVGDISASTDWSSGLVGVDVVIHTAARVHTSNEVSAESLFEFRRVNVEGTLALARQAAAAGVKRFIFISSIGVNGSTNIKPFKETDVPEPVDQYAQSKYEAEISLLNLSTETGLEIVIIRPPLVYGSNAPGKFKTLVNIIFKGLPLPFGSIHNKRTLVALDNLIDLIIICISHPNAANQIFLAGDGEDISTTQLLRGVASAMGKPSRLIPIPANLILFVAFVLGKKIVAQRLLGSLQVDISKAQELLGWTPALSVEEGLRRCFSYIKD